MPIWKSSATGPGLFNFFQREYQKQLVAGYSKNTRSNGSVAHMVDYSRFQTNDQPEHRNRPLSSGQD